MPKISTQLRLEETTFVAVRAIAARELRSLNAQIEYFILKGIAAYEKENGPINETDEYLFGAPPEQP